MANELSNEPSGLRIAFITTDKGVEQVELTTPPQAITRHDTEHAYYGAVVVRGGVTEGDLLRTAWAAVSSMQELNKADEPVAGQRVRHGSYDRGPGCGDSSLCRFAGLWKLGRSRSGSDQQRVRRIIFFSRFFL